MLSIMKHKFLVGSLFGLMGLLSTTQAEAQNFPNVKGLTPFTPPANYMSLPGNLRWRYFIDSGRWLSRAEAVNAVRDQGLSARFDPTDWHHAALVALKTDRPGARQALPISLLERGF